MLYSCLIVQKETKTGNTIKSIVTCCDVIPTQHVTTIQKNHCMEFQLVVYSKATKDLLQELEALCTPYKTSYGDNWYEFSDKVLASIVSLYFKHGVSTINIPHISDVLDFEFKFESLDTDVCIVQKPRPITKNSIEVPVKTSVKKESSPKKFKPIKFHDDFITEKDYINFIEECCDNNESSEIKSSTLNDSFIIWLTNVKEYNLSDSAELSKSSFRKLFFNGFKDLGYKVDYRDKKHRIYYIKGLSLKKLVESKQVTTDTKQ